MYILGYVHIGIALHDCMYMYVSATYLQTCTEASIDPPRQKRKLVLNFLLAYIIGSILYVVAVRG